MSLVTKGYGTRLIITQGYGLKTFFYVIRDMVRMRFKITRNIKLKLKHESKF